MPLLDLTEDERRLDEYKALVVAAEVGLREARAQRQAPRGSARGRPIATCGRRRRSCERVEAARAAAEGERLPAASARCRARPLGRDPVAVGGAD